MKPSIEEVKEKFKDAEIVESCYNNEFVIGKIKEYDDEYEATELEKQNSYHTIWNEDSGYAKILTYKNPKFEITKEQVLSLQNCVTDAKLRQWFPEVFKKELVVGKWYKCNESKFLYFPLEIKDNNHIKAYGFDKKGIYSESNENFEWGTPDSLEEATPQEVESALIGEAKKRGFVNGAFFNDLHYKSFSGKVDIVRWEEDSQDLRSGGYCVFHNGIWAEIIQPKKMTQSEIEKELGYKIEIV